jgi:hypothetical protein
MNAIEIDEDVGQHLRALSVPYESRLQVLQKFYIPHHVRDLTRHVQAQMIRDRIGYGII